MQSYELPEKQISKKAFIYCRVSSKAQTKRGDGLSSQQTRCEEYAKFRGYTVSMVFTDDMTGKLVDRPGVQMMLSSLRKYKNEGIIVVIDDISRIARDVGAHWELRDLIRAAGGELVSPSYEFKDNADSRMVENVLAGAAQHQREKNAEQTRNRMRSRLMNGYWCFQAPVGYVHKTVKGHGKLLVKDEPNASVLQEALEGFASGRFETQVAVKEFLEKHPAFNEFLTNGYLHPQRVKDILTRSVYAGMVEHENWNVAMIQGKHEGIISLKTFEKIQHRLNNKVTSRRKNLDADFPLRGFVNCGDCGKPLTACWSKSKTGKRHPYYLCHNKDCVSHRKSIRKNEIEEQFESILKKVLPSNCLLKTAGVLFENAWNQRIKQGQELRKNTTQKIKNIEDQIEMLIQRIVSTSVESVIVAYERKITLLEKEKLLLSERTLDISKPIKSFEDSFELSMKFLSNPCQLWFSNQLSNQKALLKLVFAEPLVYSKNIGFRTPKTSILFSTLKDIQSREIKMARLEGDTSNSILENLEYSEQLLAEISRQRRIQ